MSQRARKALSTERISEVRIAEAHRRTPAQVVLRWLVQQDEVIAIPKATSPAHIAENFAIFDFALSDMEMQEIFGLARRRARASS